jgi:hypothetical protein
MLADAILSCSERMPETRSGRRAGAGARAQQQPGQRRRAPACGDAIQGCQAGASARASGRAGHCTTHSDVMWQSASQSTPDQPSQGSAMCAGCQPGRLLTQYLTFSKSASRRLRMMAASACMAGQGGARRGGEGRWARRQTGSGFSTLRQPATVRGVTFCCMKPS